MSCLEINESEPKAYGNQQELCQGLWTPTVQGIGGLRVSKGQRRLQLTSGFSTSQDKGNTKEMCIWVLGPSKQNFPRCDELP